MNCNILEHITADRLGTAFCKLTNLMKLGGQFAKRDIKLVWRKPCQVVNTSWPMLSANLKMVFNRK